MKALILFLFSAPLMAQFQPLAPNMVKVCDEFCTVTQAPSATIYQFGSGTSFSKPSTLTLPVVGNCQIPCMQFGGDPAVGVGKTLYVQQQASAFNVTYTDATGTHTTAIPAMTAATGSVSTAQLATVTTADKTVALKIPLPAQTLTCTNKNNRITCPVPAQTITQNVTVPGQTANVASTPAAYTFTCSGSDMQHLTCTAVKK